MSNDGRFDVEDEDILGELGYHYCPVCDEYTECNVYMPYSTPILFCDQCGSRHEH